MPVDKFLDHRFVGKGYFSNRGVFGNAPEVSMRLDIFSTGDERITIRLLEASGYGEMSATWDESKAPGEASVTLSVEDSREIAELLRRLL
jgi:hypothetical protein